MRTLAIALVPFLLVALMISAIGCSSGQERGFRLIHKDAEGGAYFRMDIARADKDLAELYDFFLASIAEGEQELQDLGIELSQVDYLAVQMEEGDETALAVLGQFDLDNVRSSLSELDLTQGSYEGVEFWSGYYGEYGDMGVAFVTDGLIWGDEEVVKSLVRTIKGSDLSFHDVPAVREVLDRLPGWTPLMAMVSLQPLSDFDIPDAEAAGYVVSKKDSNTLKGSMVVKFVDEDTARQMLEVLVEGPEIKARRDGRFVIIDSEVPIEDFADTW